MTAAWLGLHALLLGAALWTWDAVLLKRHLDGLLPMAGVLTGVFALVMSIWWTAKRARRLRPGWLHSAWKRIGRRELAYVGLFLVLLLALHFGFQRARSDGRAYFIQVRSLVMEGNFEFEAEEQEFGFAGDANIFAFGTPLLWTPFFLAAHLWLTFLNLLGGNYLVNGFFNPYQRAVAVGSLVYGMVGLVLIDTIVRRYYERRIATLATISTCVGGFAVWYLTIDGSYSHAVSMFTVTAFLAYWDTTRREWTGRERDRRQWAGLGLLAGLMAMARWQNALFAVVPAIEALRDYGTLLRERKYQASLGLLGKHLVFSGCILVAFFPQSLVWELSRGSWFDLPDQDHAIFWFDPEPSRELLSPDRGLFAWTPLLLFAVLGLFLFIRKRPWVGMLLTTAFLAQIYISSTIVSIGHGHAARKFTNCTLVFVLGLAALLTWLRRRPLVAPVAVILAFFTLNFFFMLDLRTTTLEQAPTVPFHRIVESTTSRAGNPFLVPWNLWFAWRYETRPSHWELIDTQTYNNVPIDVGHETDEKFLGIGWSGRERAPGMDFRWAVGRRATILAKLKARDRYAIHFTGAPLQFPEAPPQLVRVYANGQFVDEVEVARLGQYSVIVEPRLMRRGLNVIRFEFSRSDAPADVGLSDDPRELALLFDRIRLRRNPDL